MTSTRPVTTHRGIRYATAERFEPPVMVSYRPGSTPGDASGPICPQVPGMLERLLGMEAAAMDEDCLFLDVYAPADATPASRLPVLVWIHGGAYLNGAGSIAWYDGSRLAARGQVVVTINYRLGALGFLGGGNWGTLDQICALEWVRDHIVAFGGDAGNVTIFGESAGGSAVLSLMAATAAQGLFHRVWSMSPSINQLRTLERADEWAAAFFAAAEVNGLDEARALPLERLLEAQTAVMAMPNTGYDMFSPAAGGAGLPDDVLGAAATSPIPLSIGTNRDESLLFLAFDPALSGAGEERWVAYLAHQFGEAAAEARAAYEAARPGASTVALIAAVQTDTTFRRPAQRLAEARARVGTPTWMYWFTWASPALGGILGSAHALDIPFAFDNVHAPGAEMMLGEGPELAGLAARFADEIAAFAAGGSASWPAFGLDGRPTLRLDADVEVVHDPEPELRALHH
jgi:para-nitrobenzyl esterase